MIIEGHISFQIETFRNKASNIHFYSQNIHKISTVGNSSRHFEI